MGPSQRTKRVPTVFSPKKPFPIALRRPWSLPSIEVKLAPPDPPPTEPANVSWLTLLLPPVLMGIGMGAYALAFRGNNPLLLLPMLLMGLGFPVANIFTHLSERKRYQRALEERRANYLAYLHEERQRIEDLARQQYQISHQEYPDVAQIEEWALPRRKSHRLWWRRPEDKDFLNLRMGIGEVPPAFQVLPPDFADSKDPLREIADHLVADFKTLNGMPLLLDLRRAGSVSLTGPSAKEVYGLAYRLVIDLLFHHSPQDVELVVLAPRGEKAAQLWGWLKWAPHTFALESPRGHPHLAFDRARLDAALDWMMKVYYRRSHQEERGRALVVLVGESSSLRRSADIVELAEHGHEVGIYLLFVGGHHVPRECRAQLRVRQGRFEYQETWAVEENPLIVQGSVELASVEQGEQLTRALAPLEPTTNQAKQSLPERVSLFDVLEIAPRSSEELAQQLQQNWQHLRDPDEQLQFPFGVHFDRRRGLKPAMLNLLPERYGGIGAYHSILVGTTGSGKSEFMKALVLAAAYHYSPRQLNFFFMDFKGGAAFNIFKRLPHTVGIVTNLSPELVERGLNAIEFELERRQRLLAHAQVSDIWAYNLAHPHEPMPHLLLLLDEFARGMEDFDQLPELLNRLVRIGRSLGMYLFLANQDVNTAVNRLLNNIGWRIALKVARQEEMEIIDRRLPIAERGKGEGYLFSTLSPDGSPPVRFQAGYAGFTLHGKRDAATASYTVYEIKPDGRWITLEEIRLSETQEREQVTEQQLFLKAVEQVMKQNSSLEARPIYLDPLDVNISLTQVYQSTSPQRAFDGQTWQTSSSTWAIPIGFLDSPEQCFQDVLSVDFENKDGHLWILGAPDSGVDEALRTLVLSLATLKTPTEAQIYIIESGASRLAPLRTLPHVGAVIRVKERERVERLFSFLDEEIERRAISATEQWPHLFLIIDGYAGFKREYDENERIAHYAQIGKSVGLHLVITTTRRVDLWSGVADNIARRLVLYLANPDEYFEALDIRVRPLRKAVRGKGYWRDEAVYLCQVALPTLAFQSQGKPQEYIPEEIAPRMDAAWQGPRPIAMGTLPVCVPLEDFLNLEVGPDEIPFGLSYEDLQPFIVDLRVEAARVWGVLGLRRMGKTNFLYVLTHLWHAYHGEETAIILLGFKDVSLAPPPGVAVYRGKGLPEGFASVQQITEQQPGASLLVLLDDLDLLLGQAEYREKLEKWVSYEARWKNVRVVAAGPVGNLMAYLTHPLVKQLRQNRVGMVLGKDGDALNWMGVSLPHTFLRRRLPPGRGFWISGGQMVLVQTPKVSSCGEGSR